MTPNKEHLQGLVERLKVLANSEGGGAICDGLDEAADTLESLAAESERLRGAIENYMADCTNPECDFCIVARKALSGGSEQ